MDISADAQLRSVVPTCEVDPQVLERVPAAGGATFARLVQRVTSKGSRKNVLLLLDYTGLLVCTPAGEVHRRIPLGNIEGVVVGSTAAQNGVSLPQLLVRPVASAAAAGGGEGAPQGLDLVVDFAHSPRNRPGSETPDDFLRVLSASLKILHGADLNFRAVPGEVAPEAVLRRGSRGSSMALSTSAAAAAAALASSNKAATTSIDTRRMMAGTFGIYHSATSTHVAMQPDGRLILTRSSPPAVFRLTFKDPALPKLGKHLIHHATNKHVQYATMRHPDTDEEFVGMLVFNTEPKDAVDVGWHRDKNTGYLWELTCKQVAMPFALNDQSAAFLALTDPPPEGAVGMWSHTTAPAAYATHRTTHTHTHTDLATYVFDFVPEEDLSSLRAQPQPDTATEAAQPPPPPPPPPPPAAPDAAPQLSASQQQRLTQQSLAEQQHLAAPPGGDALVLESVPSSPHASSQGDPQQPSANTAPAATAAPTASGRGAAAGPQQVAEELHAAMRGLGTDEDAVYRTLQRVSGQQVWDAARLRYASLCGDSLDAALRAELTAAELRRCEDILAGRGVALAAAASTKRHSQHAPLPRTPPQQRQPSASSAGHSEGPCSVYVSGYKRFFGKYDASRAGGGAEEAARRAERDGAGQAYRELLAKYPRASIRDADFLRTDPVGSMNQEVRRLRKIIDGGTDEAVKEKARAAPTASSQSLRPSSSRRDGASSGAPLSRRRSSGALAEEVASNKYLVSLSHERKSREARHMDTALTTTGTTRGGGGYGGSSRSTRLPPPSSSALAYSAPPPPLPPPPPPSQPLYELQQPQQHNSHHHHHHHQPVPYNDDHPQQHHPPPAKMGLGPKRDSLYALGWEAGRSSPQRHRPLPVSPRAPSEYQQRSTFLDDAGAGRHASSRMIEAGGGGGGGGGGGSAYLTTRPSLGMGGQVSPPPDFVGGGGGMSAPFHSTRQAYPAEKHQPGWQYLDR